MSSQVVEAQGSDAPTGLDADVEGLARRITRDVWDYTGGLPGRWVPLMIIQERLALEDGTATIGAAQLAVAELWLEEFGDYNSIRLAPAGRSTGAAVEEAPDLQAGTAIAPIAKNKAA